MSELANLEASLKEARLDRDFICGTVMSAVANLNPRINRSGLMDFFQIGLLAGIQGEPKKNVRPVGHDVPQAVVQQITTAAMTVYDIGHRLGTYLLSTQADELTQITATEFVIGAIVFAVGGGGSESDYAERNRALFKES